MAQVKLIGPNFKIRRTVGMHAPKRPEKAESWFKAAAKALSLQPGPGVTFNMTPTLVTPDRIVFEFVKGNYLDIDRKALALGMR
mgnify:CR=1 FL=1